MANDNSEEQDSVEETSNRQDRDVDEEVPRRPDQDSWYKQEDLRIKRQQLYTQRLSVLVALLGIIGLVISIRYNTSSVRASVHSYVMTNVTNLDKLFVDHPDLYDYFYSGMQPDMRNPVDYKRAQAAADQIADVLDIVDVQSKRFRDQWDAPDAWDAWTTDMLKCSPILREYLNGHRDWYGPSLVRKLDQLGQQPTCEKNKRAAKP